MQPSFNNGWKTKPADRSFPWALPMAMVVMTFGQNYSLAPGFQMPLGLIEIGFQPNVVLDTFSMGVAHG